MGMVNPTAPLQFMDILLNPENFLDDEVSKWMNMENLRKKTQS